jgi:hypothetical protein
MFLLIGALSLSGCGSTPEFRTDPRLASLRSSERTPLPFSVAFAPIRLGFDPSEVNRKAVKRFSLPPDVKHLREVLLRDLETLPLFADLRPLGSPDSPMQPLEEAWNEKADLLLDITLLKWEAAWRGNTAWYIPNLFLWFELLLPSYWVPDERYGMDMGFRIRVTSVHTGKVVYEGIRNVAYEESLNDFERGWQFLGIFRVPGSLGPSNWARVASNLEAGSRVEFEVALARALGEDLRRASETSGFRRAMHKRMAFVVGCTNYGHEAFPRALYARRDAEALHRFLVDPEGGGLPDRNATILVGEHATKEGILSKLRSCIVDRMRPGDEAIVHFSGLGTLLDSPTGETRKAGTGDPVVAKPLLLPYDAQPEALAKTAIPLETLLSILHESPGKILLILDTSFQKEGGNRALESNVKGTALLPLDRQAANVTLLTACTLDEECGLVKDRRHGTFMFHFLLGARGRGDVDEDGRVDLREAFRYARNKTAIMALLDGRSQRPSMLGDGGTTILIKGIP